MDVVLFLWRQIRMRSLQDVIFRLQDVSEEIKYFFGTLCDQKKQQRFKKG